MKIRKRLLSAIMVLAMLASIISTTALAVNEPTIEVSTANVQEGKAETVDITISLKNNPGIVSMLLSVEYDKNILTLKNVSDAGKLGSQSHSNDYTLNPYILYWSNGTATSNYVVDGTVATLTFDIAANANVGNYPISVSYDKDNDGIFDVDFNPVDFKTVEGGLTISEKPKENFNGLSFANATYVYDGTAKSISVAGLPTGATVTYTSDDFDNDGKAIDAGTYNVKATVKKEGFNDWTKEAVLTINPKPVSVTGLTVANKSYDGTDTAILSGGTISGIVSRDASEQYCDIHNCYRIKYSVPQNGKFADKNVGTNKSVTIDKIQLDGCSADNYTLTQPTNLKGNITAADIVVNATSAQKRLGSNDPELEYSYTGKLYGSDAFTGKLTRKAGETVGKYDILQGTLSLGNNYKITYNKAVFEIVDKTPQNVVVSSITAKKYGDAEFELNVTPDSVSGLNSFAFESSNTDVAEISNTGKITIKKAGKTNITVKQAGNDEYAQYVNTQELVVNKVDINITADAKTKKVGTNDPELTYQYTGKLVGTDVFSGSLTRQTGEEVGKYDILQGTLALNDNYNITYNKAVFDIVDKTPQIITIKTIDTKTYGDTKFSVEVTPDETSKLDSFTYSSSDEKVATVDENGEVTIIGAGETEISVTEAGNDDYAKTTLSAKLVVNPKGIAITSLDVKEKTVVFNGVLEADNDMVALDFDKIKTTVVSANKDTVEEVTTITTQSKVSNFKLKGEKAANYVVDTESFDIETITDIIVEELTEDENVTIEATQIDDKTLLITDIAVATEAEVKKVTIDVTSIDDTKVSTVAISKNIFDTIATVDQDAILEIALKDSSEENNTVTLVINTDALSAIQTALGTSSTISFSVEKTESEDLKTEQVATISTVATKSPAVFSFNVNDAEGNSLADNFGEGNAKVEVYYEKPEGNGNVVVKCLKEDGTLENVVSEYNATTKIVTMTLKHFSNYLIYTEPVETHRSSGGGGSSSGYTVKFETNGGSTIKSISIAKNSVVSEPTVPTKEGYKFEGWYVDKELTTAYNFESKVTKGLTLYAKWTEISKDENKSDEKKDNKAEEKSSYIFNDIRESDWFYNAVKFAFEKGITSGVSETEFAPNDKVTRGQFITMLCRAYGISEMTGDNFADAGNTWYTGYLAAAKQLGISNGVGDDKFAPEAEITREEMVTLIYNYMKSQGKVVKDVSETNFADNAEISDWAKTSVAYAADNGIVNGKGDNKFAPKDNATRAELAQIFFNILNK